MHQQIVLSSRLGSILPVSLYISLSSYYCNYDDCLTIKKECHCRVQCDRPISFSHHPKLSLREFASAYAKQFELCPDDSQENRMADDNH